MFLDRRHAFVALGFLLLRQHEIDNPTPANVGLINVAAVVEDVFAVAPGVLKGIRENGHRGEVTRFVQLLSE